MLYEIIPNTPRSNYDPRQNLGPYADGIVGFANAKSTDSVTIHLKELSLNQFVGGPTSSMSSNPTHLMDVHSMQSLTDPNGNQQPGKNKKKGHNNNLKSGKNNNKPKDNGNNERTNNNASEGKKERHKVKFPCNLCTYAHLTHLCPKLAEATRLLSLPPTVLKNPFPHNQQMTLSSSNARNVVGGSQKRELHCLSLLNLVP
jgi:hypothetical protein